ncbi:MAG: hypothetical protein LBL91_04830 [Lachnospiraceae bacterium]|jgi:hypothetical protein|nr:hypothetical protein [Lachnospiraceae bacterium]
MNQAKYLTTGFYEVEFLLHSVKERMHIDGGDYPIADTVDGVEVLEGICEGKCIRTVEWMEYTGGFTSPDRFKIIRSL